MRSSAPRLRVWREPGSDRRSGFARFHVGDGHAVLSAPAASGLSQPNAEQLLLILLDTTSWSPSVSARPGSDVRASTTLKGRQ